MELAGFEDLIKRGRDAVAVTASLRTRTRAGLLMAKQLQAEIHSVMSGDGGRARGDAGVDVMLGDDAAITFNVLFPAQGGNPYDSAKTLIDEFGRRARSVAMARSLVGLHREDERAASHWRSAFEAILHIQEPVGTGAVRRLL